MQFTWFAEIPIYIAKIVIYYHCDSNLHCENSNILPLKFQFTFRIPIYIRPDSNLHPLRIPIYIRTMNSNLQSWKPNLHPGTQKVCEIGSLYPSQMEIYTKIPNKMRLFFCFCSNVDGTGFNRKFSKFYYAYIPGTSSNSLWARRYGPF